MNSTRIVSILTLSSLPLIASAEWTGKGEAGVALSTANTGAKTKTIAAKFDVASEVEKWKHALGGSMIYTSAREEADAEEPNPDDETTANRWELHQQTNYKFNERMFVFGALRHEEDDIGSFSYQSALTTGLGYKFMDTEETKLSVQAGVGYKKFKQSGELEGDSEAIVTGLVELRQVLTSTTVLIDKLSIEHGSTNTLLQNDLALQVKMTDVLALAVGHQLRYNTAPGPRAFGVGEYAHSDRLLTLNLVYELK